METPPTPPNWRFKPMAEIIEEHKPSGEVLKRWLQSRGMFCSAETALRDAPLHVPDVYDEERILAWMALEKSGKAGFVTDTKGCARCGNRHNALTYYQFTNLPQPYQMFAICPTSGEPILMTTEEDDGAKNPLSEGVWFRSATSGGYYRNPAAAGSIVAVVVDGVTFGEDALLALLLRIGKGSYTFRKKFDEEDDSWDVTDHTAPSLDDPFEALSLPIGECIIRLLQNQER